MLEVSDKAWPKLLERACAAPLTTIWFEPIADMARGTTAGYQTRPRFPLGGDDTSGWLQAADLHGHSGRLAAAMLSAALSYRDDLPFNTILIVELSATGALSPEVGAVLRSVPDLSLVALELTGLPPDVDHESLARALQPSRDVGALVSIKETGRGHAGLLHLINLVPDFVKVDGALITGLDQDPRRAAAVVALGNLAGELDAWLIADGVTRPPEIDKLRELGVPLAQGPLIGRAQELMTGLPEETRRLLRTKPDTRSDELTLISTPVRAVPARPEVATEITVVVDHHRRPLEVIVPSGRRTRSHPPLCVQRHDKPKEVALRAAARPAEDRLAPLCLCDELGRLRALIGIEALLQAIARAA